MTVTVTVIVTVGEKVLGVRVLDGNSYRTNKKNP